MKYYCFAMMQASGVVQKESGQQEEEEEEDEKPRGGLMRGFQTANANHGSKNPKQMKTKDMLKNMSSGVEVEQQMSRKERWAILSSPLPSLLSSTLTSLLSPLLSSFYSPLTHHFSPLLYSTLNSLMSCHVMS
jgi:hypothetical protein